MEDANRIRWLYLLFAENSCYVYFALNYNSIINLWLWVYNACILEFYFPSNNIIHNYTPWQYRYNRRTISVMLAFKYMLEDLLIYMDTTYLSIYNMKHVLRFY